MPVDENKINKKMTDLLDEQIDSAKSAGKDVKNIPHKDPGPNAKPGEMMDFTTMFESMNELEQSMNTEKDPMESEINPSNSYDETKAMEELSRIFTPVLVMQDFEKDIADKSMAELESADVLTERTIIQFDDETRMSQLIAVCAKIIAKQKNTEAWQMFKKASVIKKEAALNMQKEEYDDAKILAQKYLVAVSTTNPSSVARNAATELLPQTQH